MGRTARYHLLPEPLMQAVEIASLKWSISPHMQAYRLVMLRISQDTSRAGPTANIPEIRASDRLHTNTRINKLSPLGGRCVRTQIRYRHPMSKRYSCPLSSFFQVNFASPFKLRAMSALSEKLSFRDHSIMVPRRFRAQKGSRRASAKEARPQTARMRFT